MRDIVGLVADREILIRPDGGILSRKKWNVLQSDVKVK